MQLPRPTLPAGPWPGSSIGRAGAGKQTESTAGALLQLAVAKGVELDVPRDGLARADQPLVAVSGLLPLGHSLQAWRKHRHLHGSSSPGSRAAGRTACSWKGMCSFKTVLQGALHVALGKPKALAFKSCEGACVPSHRCVCEECACSKPAP